jgi:hypothetical protein
MGIRSRQAVVRSPLIAEGCAHAVWKRCPVIEGTQSVDELAVLVQGHHFKLYVRTIERYFSNFR